MIGFIKVDGTSLKGHLMSLCIQWKILMLILMMWEVKDMTMNLRWKKNIKTYKNNWLISILEPFVHNVVVIHLICYSLIWLIVALNLLPFFFFDNFTIYLLSVIKLKKSNKHNTQSGEEKNNQLLIHLYSLQLYIIVVLYKITSPLFIG